MYFFSWVKIVAINMQGFAFTLHRDREGFGSFMGPRWFQSIRDCFLLRAHHLDGSLTQINQEHVNGSRFQSAT